MLYILNENIFNKHSLPKHKVFGHGCNIYNTMGAGIAKEIKNKFPKLYQEDLNTKKGDRSKLGQFTHIQYGNYILFNLYTQATYWDKSDMFKIDYLEKSLINSIYFTLKKYHNTCDYKLEYCIPAIGLGLANGNIQDVKDCITDIANEVNKVCDIYWYILDPKLYKGIVNG